MNQFSHLFLTLFSKAFLVCDGKKKKKKKKVAGETTNTNRSLSSDIEPNTHDGEQSQVKEAIKNKWTISIKNVVTFSYV